MGLPWFQHPRWLGFAFASLGVSASVVLRFLRFRSGFGIVHAVRTLKTAQAADFSLSDQDFLPSASLSHSALALASVRFRSRSCAPFRFLPLLTNPGLDQALDRLVSSSFIRCRTFTDDLSTSSSLRGLTCSKQWQFFSLGGASRLDAFSVYPGRTSLPCCALGRTTVAPEVRPSRSSRTRDSSHQNSCAHDG